MSAEVIRWKISGRQWHYGVVIAEATDSDPDGPYVDVEYTHSVPASNQAAGRRVRVYGIHVSERVR